MNVGTIWYMFWTKSYRLKFVAIVIFFCLIKIILLKVDSSISMRRDQVIQSS